jgi:uncharacterized protein (DUF169 family)
MYDGTDYARALTELLRPQTRPLVVKLLGPDEAIPNRVHRPTRLLKQKVTVCQAASMARRYGWKLGLLKDDVCCAAALVAYGWVEQEPSLDEFADLMLAAQYAENRDAARRQIEAIPRLPKGQCAGLVLSPMDLADWEPDVFVLYGNAAQAMRLVHAATYHEGYPIRCSFGGRAASCAEGIIRAVQTDQCQLVLPGGGDRVFAMTADDELCFTAPIRLMDRLLEGLEKSGRKVGMAYPIPFYQGFEPRFPASYRSLFDRIT